MNCEKARDLLHAYNDGELKIEVAREIKLHVESCVDCGLAFAGVSGQDAVLRAAVQDSIPKIDIVPQVMAKIQPSVQPARRARLKSMIETIGKLAAIFAAIAYMNYRFAQTNTDPWALPLLNAQIAAVSIGLMLLLFGARLAHLDHQAIKYVADFASRVFREKYNGLHSIKSPTPVRLWGIGFILGGLLFGYII